MKVYTRGVKPFARQLKFALLGMIGLTWGSSCRLLVRDSKNQPNLTFPRIVVSGTHFFLDIGKKQSQSMVFNAILSASALKDDVRSRL